MFGRAREHFVRDGLHEVGLAEAGRTVDEERVVLLPGRFGDGVRGGGGELVRLADDEVIEGVAVVQRLGARIDRRHRGRGRLGRRGRARRDPSAAASGARLPPGRPRRPVRRRPRWPPGSASAAYFSSFQRLAKSSGVLTINVPPSNEIGSFDDNQVWIMGSGISRLAPSRTRFQRSLADSGIRLYDGKQGQAALLGRPILGPECGKVKPLEFRRTGARLLGYFGRRVLP